LGVTPSAWFPSYRSFSLGYSSNGLFSGASTQLGVNTNAYLDSGVIWRYTTSNPASQYIQSSGAHQWFTAASGTAGNAVSWTQAMTLDASGNLMVGSTSTSGIANKNIDVNGTGDAAFVVRVGGTSTSYLYSTAGTTILGTGSTIPLVFNTNNTEVGRFTSAGNFGVGNTVQANVNYQFGTSLIDSFGTIPNCTIGKRLGVSDLNNSPVLSLDYYSSAYGMDLWVGTTGLSPGYIDVRQNEALIFRNNTYTGTARETMRITAAGNVGIGTTSPAFKLSVYEASTTAYATVETGTAGAYAIFLARNPNNDLYLWNRGDNNTSILSSTAWDLIIAANAAKYISFQTNGSERARITSGGDVGIGTTSPSQRLDVTVSSSTEGSGLAVTNSLTGGYGSGLTFYSLRSDTSAKLVAGSIVINGASAWNSDATTSSSMIFSTVGANTLAERARIDSSGNLLLGTTSSALDASPGYKFLASTTQPNMGIVVNSTASTGLSNYHHYNTNATNNGYRFYIVNNGGIYNFSANNSNLSDRRQKKNIEPAGAYLAKMMAIPVVTFDYIDQAEDDPGKTLGVIAQDVESVAPELVNNKGFGETPEDGVPLKSIYQTDFQYALLKCIQEQQAIIESLKARLDAANL
jgi:hypothetical protein